MLYPQYQMRSLMVVIAISAVGAYIALWVAHLNRGEMDDLKDHLRVATFLLTPLLVLVLLKMGWSWSAE